MKKWVCPFCGYVYEGDVPPAECPVCHVSGDKFTLQYEEKTWAAEHVVGVGKVFGEDVPEEVRKEIIDGLRANFEGECSEVGMYLAMARVAHREGYPEIGMYWEKAGLEEAEHAAEKRSALALPLRPERHGDDRTLGKILNGNAEGQDKCACRRDLRISRKEACIHHADCHSLRDIM